MKIWNQVQSALSRWRLTGRTDRSTDTDASVQHLLAANKNLATLLEDSSIPPSVRAELSAEFAEIERISQKLLNEEIHVAVFGRVGVGKSTLLNALLAKHAFTTSPLHGETRVEAREAWDLLQDGKVVLIDTPGIDELAGGEREELARKISKRADVILMVCEGDLTRLEHEALLELVKMGRSIVLVLNKSDRYNDEELHLLMERLRERTAEWLSPSSVVSVSAEPRAITVIRQDQAGNEREEKRQQEPDIGDLKHVLWELLEKDGKSLAALNAALFASDLDAEVARRIVAARKSVAERIIRSYCITKSLLVAVNPVPLADLLAAAGTDVAMVIHLGEVYGIRLSRREAARLLLTISAQLLALMSAYWGLNLVSSALKIASVGLSAALTATAQGALAWYATYLTGRMAQTWFAKGKSWGSSGPREVARKIIASLDRDALIRTARQDLASRLESGGK